MLGLCGQGGGEGAGWVVGWGGWHGQVWRGRSSCLPACWLCALHARAACGAGEGPPVTTAAHGHNTGSRPDSLPERLKDQPLLKHHVLVQSARGLGGVGVTAGTGGLVGRRVVAMTAVVVPQAP